MKIDENVIKNCPLFMNIKDEEVPNMLKCLNSKEKAFKKGEFILNFGDKPSDIGIVLSGSVHVIREDYWGNRAILTSIGQSNLFCEAFSCAEAENLTVSVVANQDTKILLIDYKKIINPNSPSCEFHSRLIQNMLKILANKNIVLTHKIEHITQKTTREKLLSYLSEQALLQKSERVVVPFNRQELADYLSVERSALSGTLGNMQKEGIIEFYKNVFVLKEQ